MAAEWKPGEPLPESSPWARRLFVFLAVAALMALPAIAILYELELIRSTFEAVNAAVEDGTGFIGQRIIISASLANMVIPPSLQTIHDSTIWAYITINVVALCYLIAPSAATLVQGLVAMAAIKSSVPTFQRDTQVDAEGGASQQTKATGTATEPPKTEGSA